MDEAKSSEVKRLCNGDGMPAQTRLDPQCSLLSS